MAEYTVVTKDKEYIPEWNGNKEAAEPIVFTLRYLTNAQRSECFKTQANARGDVFVEPDNVRLVKLGVKKIESFSVNGKAIETVRDFLEVSGFDGLFSEVATQVLVMNAREDTGPLP